jgi:hypothetical protein
LQVSKKNLMEIVKKLMVHMDKAEGTIYRDELLVKIIDICSQDNYHFITSFEWFGLLHYCFLLIHIFCLNSLFYI